MNPFKDKYDSFLEMCQSNGIMKLNKKEDIKSSEYTEKLIRKVEKNPALIQSIVEEIDEKVDTNVDIKQNVLCKYGQICEQEVVKKHCVRDSNKLYKKYIGDIKLYGRIDGFKDGRLVEIKNRRKFCRSNVYTTDQIQTHCYMYLLDKLECDLLERTPDGEERVTRIFWNSIMWEYIVSKLNEVLRMFQLLIYNPKFIDQMLKDGTLDCLEINGIPCEKCEIMKTLSTFFHNTSLVELISEYVSAEKPRTKRHRCGDLPAVIQDNGMSLKWYYDGKLHRENDLPAITWKNGTKEWYTRGKRHRYEKPAIVSSKGDSWYLYGKRQKII